MGTRNLVCAVIDNEMKVAFYGQWDGYLSGQGKVIIDFIRKGMKLNKFKKALRECSWATPEEVKKTWVDAGDKPDNDSGLVSMDVSDKHSLMYPQFSRDTGAKIFGLIQDGTYSKYDYKKEEIIDYTFEPVRKTTNSVDFADDGLFCEYAYVLDMDNKVLEIYSDLGEDNKRFPALKLFAVVPFKDCKARLIKELEKKEMELREREEVA